MARIIDGSVMNMVGDKVRELRIEKGMSRTRFVEHWWRFPD